MRRAGIGRRMGGGGGGGAGWGEEYTLSVEIFDRKGGFRLFCSYGRVSIMHQGVGVEGRWMTKLAVTGFASCWHFSAASRDSVHGRFETIKDYFERAHEPGLEHCLCTEVTAMHKKTGRMAVLYASSKESRRRLAGEKNGTSYFEEELRPAFASSAGVMASTASGSSHPGLPPSLSSFCAPSPGIPYLAASGIAVSKVSTPPSTSSLSPLPAGIPSMDEEKEQKYRVDRLYLIFSTERRWDLPKIFEGLEWT
ncbi:hypothetical protein Naga_100283g6 [Nannochloropsis gaditana]|uniref:Uncharacterized protein n=1 Tax=Nannochloropsis gaditana TaxID=72520 RepID=W7TLK4_9STRA|nr:hypothetical protein Naga_100283g6 [Nannochloropsis gaditana]